jgi:hypothetical protein
MYRLDEHTNFCKKKTFAQARDEISRILTSGLGCKIQGYRNDKPSDWDVRYDECGTFSKLHDYFADHVKGDYRGLSINWETTHVGYISAELDRHHDENPNLHLSQVITIRSRLIEKLPDFHINAVVTPANGSTRFYIIGAGAIELNEARQIAVEIKELLSDIVGVSVFPTKNRDQCMMPYRGDKTTIISTGVLPYTEAGKKRRYHETGYGYTAYTAPDCVIALAEIQNRTKCCERTLIDEICRITGAVYGGELPEVQEPAEAFRKPASKLDDIRAITDAFSRSRAAYMLACRIAKRVIDPEAALQFYRDNQIYSGDWQFNESDREARFASIHAFLQKTFDPRKLSKKGDFREELDQNIRTYCREIIGMSENATFTKSVGVCEYGDIVTKTLKVDRREAAILKAVIKTISDRNPDHGCGRDEIGKWWSVLHEEGLVSAWEPCRRYLRLRDYLECSQQIAIDHHYIIDQRTKCMFVLENEQVTSTLAAVLSPYNYGDTLSSSTSSERRTQSNIETARQRHQVQDTCPS